MRRPLVLAGLLGALAAAPALAQPEPVRIVFRTNELASRQHLLDGAARSPGLVGLGAPGPLAARQYGRLRQRWEEAYRPPAASLPPGLEQVLPPAPGEDPAEAFDLAFLEADTAAEAAARLGLAPADAQALERLLDAQAAQVAAGLQQVDRFAALIERLERLAREADLDGFVARAARFYGVERRLPPTLFVDLLWTPSRDPGLVATQVGSHMVIPVPRGWGERDEEAGALLSTVVHELGHAFVGLLPADARAAVASALVDREGVLNAGRPNVFDEALQTALGTLVFERDRLPRTFDPGASLYEPDRGETYPDAIDALARALEAPLRAHLDTPGGFTRGFLDDGVAAQAARFGRRPLHFTRACLVLAPRPALGAAFRRVFPAEVDGAREVRDAAAFARRSRALPARSRWIVVTRDDARRRPGLLAEHGVAWAAPLVDALASGEAALAQAARRAPGAGFDVVVVARDDDGARRALVALRDAAALPEGAPLRVR